MTGLGILSVPLIALAQEREKKEGDEKNREEKKERSGGEKGRGEGQG